MKTNDESYENRPKSKPTDSTVGRLLAKKIESIK